VQLQVMVRRHGSRRRREAESNCSESREPRVRVRESPARLRESSDLTATSVGDWEWRHDGGTLAGSGLQSLHGRLGSSHARGGGVCERRVCPSVSVSLLGFYYFFFFFISYYLLVINLLINLLFIFFLFKKKKKNGSGG
jgi:hypothetical protein